MRRILIVTGVSLSLFLALVAEQPVAAQSVKEQDRMVIKAASVLTGTGETLGASLVTVVDGRIRSVEPATGTTVPAADDSSKIIDLGALTLLPGLIDTHVHIGWHFDEDGKTHSGRNPESQAQALFYAAENAYQTLLAGVTTVQSLGAEVDSDLRDHINQGTLPGPRILTSLSALFEGSGDPNQLRQEVQRLKDRGADVIKLFASASIRVGGTPTMSQAQLDAACSEANRLGLRTAVHAHGPESARRAAQAGCTVLEHGALLDRKTFEYVAQQGMYFDPNIDLVLRNYFENEDRFLGIGGYTKEAFEQMRAAVPKALASFKVALTVPDLKIVFGTDALAGSHGRNAEELIYRVQAGGQPPSDAIISATSLAAESLNLGQQIGQVHPGFRADLIAVEGNPATNIEALLAVRFVMKDGEVVRLDS